MVRFVSTGLAGAALVQLGVACSSSSSGQTFPASSTEYTAPDGSTGALETPGTCGGATGGPVAGPADNHCVQPDGGLIVQPTTKAGCTATAAPGGDDGGGSTGDDGGADAGDIGNCGDSAYGPTMYGSQGGDDDCKYDVAWTSTPICEGQAVYFTVLATRREDGKPLTGANVRPDVVLTCNHPIPNSPAARDPSPEIAPGTYVVGPIAFDKAGKWVVRFHFDEQCLDNSPESPHGHAAFWVQVP